MPGKILIVDSVATNRIVLKVKLASAYYEVEQAINPQEALSLARRTLPDIVLISSGFPGKAEFALCQSLKSDGATAAIPVVLLSAPMERNNRIRALRAGMDEVMYRPVDDHVLLARLRSLQRARDTAEELRLREGTERALGFAEPAAAFESRACAMLITPDAATSLHWRNLMAPLTPYEIRTEIAPDTLRALSRTAAPDIFVIAVDDDRPQEALRLLAEIRARSATRHCGIMVVLSGRHRDTLIDALDLGASDVLAEGFDAEELALRLSTQVQRKRLADRLRADLRDGLRAAVTDPLTGLYNRRYALPHLDRMARNAQTSRRDFAVMVADLDYFKQINDRHGHAAGDAVLREVARRMRDNLRAVDLLSRIGGEEFLIAMPDTGKAAATHTADRLCRTIRDTPVTLPGSGRQVPVTISIGVVMGGALASCRDEAARLLEQADRALYTAKAHGRDKVELSTRPAA
ncbi:response regulator receiver modulated diguanylate cyclase [Salinihabitans flavidus]|uniref:diguanylate cyclase n=1 Tax=Salinihabitans flavidus TaxID=569882 RepID=A0A1H8TS42_9RHOB|nr:diguanylate cyclase [Salinihabitans flavidus]SEO93258.1 response regulator receiver modulated diguanylate cyclase [Salinihabitans flavidus]